MFFSFWLLYLILFPFLFPAGQICPKALFDCLSLCENSFPDFQFVDVSLIVA
jgi:hypothetical protein